MARNILITGGAGFIGSHLTDELITKGYNVKVFDNLTEQVHRSGKKPPSYHTREAEFIFGDVYTIEIAQKISAVLSKTDIPAEITGKYRVGDIRHCFSDISKAERILKHKLQVSFEEGLKELSEWLIKQKADDKLDQASEQLALRGLTV